MKARIALAALMALTFVGASWELNPLVTRTAQPTGPIPVGCDESLAPSPTPRVIVAEIPERETIVPVALPPAAPPPSRSLREELDAAHRALASNDRPAFDEHLRTARTIVATYPAGGERSRAEEVLWALNDAAVLWDAQFSAPFFDETSDAYTRASRYAGYGEAVRRSTLMDDSEHRFYPAGESREFVTRVAAERLQRLGVRGVSTPPTRIARAETPAPQSTASPRRVASSSSTPHRSPSSRSHRSSPPATRKSSKPAAPAMAAPSSSPDPSDVKPSPAPAEPAPTTPPASAPSSQTSADVPASPVAEDVPTPAMTDSATTTAAPVPAEPAPEPTSTAAVPAEKRSVIVPALLILIGLGVLIVLFRASK